MMKNVLMLVGSLVILIALVFWQLFANLDNLVEGVIEKVGSDVLNTKVSVAGVSIDLKEGKAEIARLVVANPEGYSGASIFEMTKIAVELDLQSIKEEVLVINSIRIQEPKINFEGDADGGSNIQTLLDNMDSGSSGKSDTSGPEATKMIINKFELSGAEVRAITEMKPDESLEIKLPTIKASGIGKSKGGVSAAVVTKEITTEIISATLKAAAKAGIKNMIGNQKKSFIEKFKSKN